MQIYVIFEFLLKDQKFVVLPFEKSKLRPTCVYLQHENGDEKENKKRQKRNSGKN